MTTSSGQLTWNLSSDVHQLLAYHFMVNALRAATITAVVAGVAGWYMVLRRQTFAGHALSVVAFPGAAGATWLGISAQWGYFGFCLMAALVISGAASGSRARSSSDESALIGVVQAFALACGFLFVALYRGLLSQTQALLFGSFLGVADPQVLILGAVGVALLVVLGVFGRRLLFASVDPAVAAAQGIPVRLVGVVYLAILGLVVAEVSQITGALLVFALLVMPAAAAQQLTARPGLSVGLSVTLAVVIVWVGVGIAFFSTYPPGFWVTTVAFAVYVSAALIRVTADRARR